MLSNNIVQFRLIKSSDGCHCFCRCLRIYVKATDRGRIAVRGLLLWKGPGFDAQCPQPTCGPDAKSAGRLPDDLCLNSLSALAQNGLSVFVCTVFTSSPHCTRKATRTINHQPTPSVVSAGEAECVYSRMESSQRLTQNAEPRGKRRG